MESVCGDGMCVCVCVCVVMPCVCGGDDVCVVGFVVMVCVCVVVMTCVWLAVWVAGQRWLVHMRVYAVSLVCCGGYGGVLL